MCRSSLWLAGQGIAHKLMNDLLWRDTSDLSQRWQRAAVRGKPGYRVDLEKMRNTIPVDPKVQPGNVSASQYVEHPARIVGHQRCHLLW